jgi:hypothetical protein
MEVFMGREQGENNLEDLLYSKNGEEKNLQTLIKKIAKSKWGNPGKKEKAVHAESPNFEEDYIQQQKINNGYTLTTNTKGNERSLLSYENDHTYQYTEGSLAKLKKSWDKKSFWYKLFIIDMIVGLLTHITLTYLH